MASFKIWRIIVEFKNPVHIWVGLLFASILLISSSALAQEAASIAQSVEKSPPASQERKTSTATDTTDATDKVEVPVKDIQRFATAVAEIKRYYIKPVSDDELFNYAISGMLSNLDPHSSFLDPAAMQDLQMSTSGKFGGIGVEMIPDVGFIKVISPIDDTPAFKAGLKPDDVIVRINGKLVKDMTLQEAINLIRGASGTKVTLDILRKGSKKPLVFNITREIINVKTVKSELYEQHYGYIRLSFFQSNTAADLASAIKNLKQKSGGLLYGVVLDLRNNPGGLLDSAVQVTDAFLDSKLLAKYDKTIVYTKGRIPADNIRLKAIDGDLITGVPMVVLINGASASASEIVAGALQDYKRAVVIGVKSFGKGSVQTVLPIDNDTGIKLTTALYYTPAGRSIQAKGIEPDVIVADLKLPKSDTDTIVFDPIEESSLNNHLANGNGHAGAPELARELRTGKNKKEENDLGNKDFQLYEALMLLKGLHSMRGVA